MLHNTPSFEYQEYTIRRTLIRILLLSFCKYLLYLCIIGFVISMYLCCDSVYFYTHVYFVYIIIVVVMIVFVFIILYLVLREYQINFIVKMLEKLSKSSVCFMMTTLERSRHILSYSCLFKVLFALLESLLKKVTIHS